MVGSGAYSVWYLLFSISVPFTNTWFQGTTPPHAHLLSNFSHPSLLFLFYIRYTTQRSNRCWSCHSSSSASFCCSAKHNNHWVVLSRTIMSTTTTTSRCGGWRRAAAIVIEIEFKLCTPFKRKLYFSCPFRQRHRRPANTIWAQNVQSR